MFIKALNIFCYLGKSRQIENRVYVLNLVRIRLVMSFRRKLSFRKTSQQCVNKSQLVPVVPSISCIQTGEMSLVLPTLQGVAATSSESYEIPSFGVESTAKLVSQPTENKDEDLGNSSIDNSEVMEPQLDRACDYSHLQLSFAIPEGLAMDPMTPTALAVSSEFMDRIGSGLTLLRDHGKKLQKYVRRSRKFEVLKKSWKSIVNVVLIEAKDLPDGPASGANCVYCKFKLGSQAYKSKQVPKSKPTWCERFNLYVNDDNSLEVTVWYKGKQKNFMGRCIIDLSHFDKEKTHEVWHELECGFGSLHLLVTLSGAPRSVAVDNVPTTNGVNHAAPPEDDYTWYRLDNNWSAVGQLSVTVHGARGLSALGISGKADAYCVFELDNSRVQTHTVSGTTEPNWNKSYKFGVHDITSTLDITIYDESIINTKYEEILGKISIPLLRINNDEKRWYALKDRSKKSSARGNCPRLLLQMSIVWNPIKASLRVLSPKENKYVKKPPKFDIPLIYSNVLFIRDIFQLVHTCNEYVKLLFEWENREKSTVALVAWLAFWYFFRLWMLPLLILAPFLYFWTGYRSCNHSTLVPIYQVEEEISDEDGDSQKDDMTIKTRFYSLQELTLTIKNGIDYLVSLLEKLKNLANFTVPYLSYLAILILVSLSAALYIIPTNYLFMAIGVYKFTRKVLYPERIPNNDLLDFLSRIPDSETLKQWRELKVPEPNLSRANSIRRR